MRGIFSWVTNKTWLQDSANVEKFQVPAAENSTRSKGFFSTKPLLRVYLLN